MREIKFRGKRLDNGEWAYGDLLTERNKASKDSAIVFFDGYMLPKAESVIKETVGQYTGLRDKNGTEIYEGDIVEYKDFSGGLYLFREQPKTKGIIKINNLLKGIYLKGMGTFESNKAEIIGNIHDNPELLGGAEG